MGFWEALVLIIGMLCGLPVVLTGMGMLYGAHKRKANRHEDSVLQELVALREEVQRLRRQHAEEVLGFDENVQRLDRRLDRVETRLELPGAGRDAEEVRVSVRGR